MDVALTIIVGFGSAVLGAIAGFLGAVFIERRRVSRERVGVVRATLGELRVNFSSATQLLYYGGRLAEYGAETWRAANFELAQFVGDPLYRKLLHIYWMMPAMEAMSGQVGTKISGQLNRGPLEEWLQSISEAIDQLLELPQASEFREQWQRLPSLEEAANLAQEAAKGGGGRPEGTGR